MRICPRKAISFVGSHIYLNRKLCDVCAACSKQCPMNAMIMVGNETSVEELVREIEKDQVFYEQSEGGITISGGEPLLQLDFLDGLLEMCRERGIHTAVDTCGYASQESFNRIRDKVGLFLYDLKLMDQTSHLKYTGVSNRTVIENFRFLAREGSEIWVRYPVVPGINDDEVNVVGIAELMFSEGVKQINLLPYHKSGIEKYRNLNRRYMLGKIETPSDEKMNEIKKKLEAYGLAVKIGG